MFLRVLTATAFSSHVILGSLCMMPMAFAQGMPVSHGEHMEMAMSPVQPMSPVHCEQCLRVPDSPQMPMSGTCAGHCLATVSDSRAISHHPSVLAGAALPPAIPAAAASGAADAFIDATAPPNPPVSTQTIVLRF
ncbi:hypothetical protein HZA87_06050 [Candidatus Uhrbacteria bacterium]|nr:hypothetical protein [Candidatus Uhrbacteria bacterium]